MRKCFCPYNSKKVPHKGTQRSASQSEDIHDWSETLYAPAKELTICK